MNKQDKNDPLDGACITTSYDSIEEVWKVTAFYGSGQRKRVRMASLAFALDVLINQIRQEVSE